MATFHELTVVETTPQGRDGVCLSMAVPPELADTFAFQPGQYLTLKAEIDGEDVRRPYSICSKPGENTVQVGVKRVD
ncbi:MAG: FAD-binding oxidoreductase, partial [Pseudomonadota bacterium]